MSNPYLSIIASHKNRLKILDNATKFLFKSILWQDFKDIEFVIADGGSDNYEELQTYLNDLKSCIRIVRHDLQGEFSRPFLNNVGIRNAKGQYVMATDVDMVFAPNFVSELLKNVNMKRIVESRTLFWSYKLVKQIYNGEIDVCNDVRKRQCGKTKKRSTAGGCQCMHIDNWSKLRGYDESLHGWGFEDWDLLSRCGAMGLHQYWMGEEGTVLLFHQPHSKVCTLEQIERNKRIVLSKKYTEHNYNDINPDGWGGIEAL